MNSFVLPAGVRSSVLIRSCFYLASLLSLAACVRCGAGSAYRSAADETYLVPDPIRETVLSYDIKYGIKSFSAEISFDIKYEDGSSTDACTARVSGKYGEPLPFEGLRLTGSRVSNGRPGRLASEYASRLTYFVSGIIHRPDTDFIHDQNLRALSLIVIETM